MIIFSVIDQTLQKNLLEVSEPKSNIVIDLVRYVQKPAIPQRKVLSINIEDLDPSDLKKIEEFEIFVSSLIDRVKK